MPFHNEKSETEAEKRERINEYQRWEDNWRASLTKPYDDQEFVICDNAANCERNCDNYKKNDMPICQYAVRYPKKMLGMSAGCDDRRFCNGSYGCPCRKDGKNVGRIVDWKKPS